MVYRRGGRGLAEAELDAAFAALAHPVRRAVFQHLLRQGSPSAMNDLATAAGISPQLLTKHATALERAGLITREARGREKHVHPHPEALGPVRRWIEETSAYWNAQLDALEEYVTTLGDAHDSGPGED